MLFRSDVVVGLGVVLRDGCVAGLGEPLRGRRLEGFTARLREARVAGFSRGLRGVGAERVGVVLREAGGMGFGAGLVLRAVRAARRAWLREGRAGGVGVVLLEVSIARTAELFVADRNDEERTWVVCEVSGEDRETDEAERAMARDDGAMHVAETFDVIPFGEDIGGEILGKVEGGEIFQIGRASCRERV